jgi:hypothetical protein
MMPKSPRSSRSAAKVLDQADRGGARRTRLESHTVRAPRPSRARLDRDIQELTVPPGERPSRNNLPGSIEEAVLAALDQIPRAASAPPPAPPESGSDSDSDER